LDGTTLDEVERVHKETLKLVLATVNTQVDELERNAQVKATEQQRKVQAHAADVKEKAARIKFED
jgi:hypothetical protein